MPPRKKKPEEAAKEIKSMSKSSKQKWCSEATESSLKKQLKEVINDTHYAKTDATSQCDVSGIPFQYNGIDFIALEEQSNGILAISANVLEEKMRFSDNAEIDSNDWRKSTIRKKLNHDVINKFNTDDMIPIVSDLTADTGEDEYGTCEDWIALPSDSMLRKFNKIIPSYNTWIWSITPWAVKYSTMSAVSARTQSKTIYSEQPNKELGVAIVCIFRKEVIGL